MLLDIRRNFIELMQKSRSWVNQLTFWSLKVNNWRYFFCTIFALLACAFYVAFFVRPTVVKSLLLISEGETALRTAWINVRRTSWLVRPIKSPFLSNFLQKTATEAISQIEIWLSSDCWLHILVMAFEFTII